MQTVGAETFTLSGSAVLAASPVDPCRISVFTPTDPCRLLGLVIPVDAACQLQPIDPCHLAAAAVTATAVGSLGTRCNAASVSAVVTAGGDLTVRATGRFLPPNPIRLLAPTDPCNQLGSFPLFYRLQVATDGTVTNPTAQPGTPSVDLPGGISVDGIPIG